MYANIDDAWRDTIARILNSPIVNSRLGSTKEITGYQVTLCNINQTFLLNPRRKLSPQYAAAEILWYLQSSKNIDMIKAYAPQYINFAEDGEAHGAYGFRLLDKVNQFETVIRILTKNPESRQAVMSIWDKWDLNNTQHKDMPCTLSLQFLIRDSKLCLIVTMRSNDAWLGLPYDIFAFTSIQRLIANDLGIPTGWYMHQAGSEHLYEKDWQKAEEALSSINRKYIRLEHQWADAPQDFSLSWYALQACQLEQSIREYPEDSAYISIPKDNILSDLVLCCASKWKVFEQEIYSPILKEAMKHVNC